MSTTLAIRFPKYDPSIIGSVTVTKPVRAPASPRAVGFVVNPRCWMTRSTDSRVSGATPACLLSTREIVATDTPASRAMSRMVGGRECCGGGCNRLLTDTLVGA